jgi:hypothetical protein
MKQIQNLSIFPLNVLLQFAPAHWESLEDPFNGRSCPFLSSNDLRFAQFPRLLEIKSICTWGLLRLCRDDVEIGQSAERGYRLASETEGV